MFRLKTTLKVLFALYIFIGRAANAQHCTDFVENIRTSYQIPALAYAVVTSDSILELQFCGKQKINSPTEITLNSKFHIGSNTKAITSLIASDLVQQGLLKWETSFFDIFPELSIFQKNRKITLSGLLNFKVPLAAFSYNTHIADSVTIKGTAAEQRYQLAKYLLSLQPVEANNNLYLTNTGYILAGLMLEKVSGKEYKLLAHDLGKKLHIDIQFGSPALSGNNQPCGHNENLQPVTDENIKLDWLLSSGNINIALPDYSRFMQHYLASLEGKSTSFSPRQIKYLLTTNKSFSFGWFNTIERKNRNHIFYNFGNANGFMSSVIIIKNKGIAFIVFTNISSEKAEEGINKLVDALKKQYHI